MTDRCLVSIDGNIIHLIDMVVKEALLRMGLDDLAQGLPTELFGRKSRRLTVQPLWRPERSKRRRVRTHLNRQRHSSYSQTLFWHHLSKGAASLLKR